MQSQERIQERSGVGHLYCVFDCTAGPKSVSRGHQRSLEKLGVPVNLHSVISAFPLYLAKLLEVFLGIFRRVQMK